MRTPLIIIIHLGLVVDGMDSLDEHTAALPEDGVFCPMYVGFKHPVLLKVYYLRSISASHRAQIYLFQGLGLLGRNPSPGMASGGTHLGFESCKG